MMLSTNNDFLGHRAVGSLSGLGLDAVTYDQYPTEEAVQTIAQKALSLVSQILTSPVATLKASLSYLKNNLFYLFERMIYGLELAQCLYDLRQNHILDTGIKTALINYPEPQFLTNTLRDLKKAELLTEDLLTLLVERHQTQDYRYTYASFLLENNVFSLSNFHLILDSTCTDSFSQALCIPQVRDGLLEEKYLREISQFYDAVSLAQGTVNLAEAGLLNEEIFAQLSSCRNPRSFSRALVILQTTGIVLNKTQLQDLSRSYNAEHIASGACRLYAASVFSEGNWALIKSSHDPSGLSIALVMLYEAGIFLPEEQIQDLIKSRSAEKLAEGACKLHKASLLTEANWTKIKANQDPSKVSLALITLHNKEIVLNEEQLTFLVGLYSPQDFARGLCKLHEAGLSIETNWEKLKAFFNSGGSITVLVIQSALTQESFDTLVTQAQSSPSARWHRPIEGQGLARSSPFSAHIW